MILLYLARAWQKSSARARLSAQDSFFFFFKASRNFTVERGCAGRLLLKDHQQEDDSRAQAAMGHLCSGDSKLPLALSCEALGAGSHTPPAQRARSLGPKRARRLCRLVAASRLLFMRDSTLNMMSSCRRAGQNAQPTRGQEPQVRGDLTDLS